MIIREKYMLADQVINGQHISPEEARDILSIGNMTDIFSLMAEANRVRHHFKGNRIDLCAIINARSGKCSEDCAFCAQSVHHKTKIDEYPLMPTDTLTGRARNTADLKARRLSLVTSGRGINTEHDIEQICTALRQIKNNLAIRLCASLGTVSKDTLLRFKEAGLERYHHNLETSESFFPNICTTHTYQERVETVKNAKAAGLNVCSGALFGLGEEREHRIELAFALKELDVDSVPLNFLTPIPGTPLADAKPLPPLEILKTIAMFRFVLPDKDIRICGGREINLRGLQAFTYIAGANGTMIGNYLTTSGREASHDLQDIHDLSLIPHKDDEVYVDYPVHGN
jgi:biotin synthase